MSRSRLLKIVLGPSILVCCIAFFSSMLLAYSVGPSTATTATNVANWTNWTASQLSSKDDQRATTNQTAATGTLSGFDFSAIPAGYIIDGIVVHIQASESHTAANGYLITYLSWDNGTSYTEGKLTPPSGELPTSDTDYNVGGASDTWGHSWTVSEVTSTFKVKTWGYCASTSRLTQVDYVAVTVYYHDGVKPGPITNLSGLTGTYGGEINLTWTSPGDDGYTVNIENGKFRIKASTQPGYSFVYTDYSVEIPTSTTIGSPQSYTLKNLISGATYYICIWTGDEVPNWSELSNVATTWAKLDEIAPGNITTLSALPASAYGRIDLTWTAPGDDGYINDIVNGKFRIKASTQSGYSFVYTDYDVELPTSTVVGSPQSYRLGNLIAGATYYIRIWTGDDVPNWSGASNGATTWASATIIAFTEDQNPLGTPSDANQCVAFGDYDNDGDLDIATAGNYHFCTVKNTNGTFAKDQEPMGKNDGFSSGNLAFGDYDNDGDLDLAASGIDYSTNDRLILFRNTAGSFSEDQNPMGGTTKGVSFGDLDFGDYDNDGDLDLAVSGQDDLGNNRLILFKNTNGNFTSDQNPMGGTTKGVSYSDLAFGDYDNDGDLDLAVSGTDDLNKRRLILFKNTNGNFTSDQNPMGGTTKGICYGDLDFGDYDNDGDLDLAVSGYDHLSKRRLILFKNTNGNFSEDQNPMGGTTKGVYFSSIAFGDYDNDGDLDLAVSGEDDLNKRRLILFNNTNGTFIEEQNPMGTENGLSDGDIEFADYDGDNDLDFAANGVDMSPEIRLILFKNSYAGSGYPNTKPGLPQNLSSSFNEGEIELTWNSATDGGGNPTPQNGLYYNIRVGTGTGVSVSSSVVTGIYSSPLMGNYLRPKFSSSQYGVRLKGVPDNTTYYWTVHAIDTALEPGDWATVNSIYYVPSDIPPEAITTLSALTGTYGGKITLTWTSPGDDGWVNNFDDGGEFDIRYSTTASQSPSISTTTFANCSSVSAFGTIPTPVTALWPHSMILNGLIPGATYYFAIRTADEGPNWSGLSNGATAWTLLDSIAPEAVTTLSGLPGNYGGQIKLTWTSPGDDGWSNNFDSGSAFDIRYSTTASQSPSISTTTFAACSSVSIFSPIPTPVIALWPYSMSVTGLTEGVTYYFAMRTRDDVPNWSGLSNGATAMARIDDIPPSTITDLQAQTSLQVQLSWTAPGDDDTVGQASFYTIRYSSTSPFDWDTATIWKSSRATTGPYGTAESETVTGLAPGTTYYFRIKAYDSSLYWSLSTIGQGIPGTFIGSQNPMGGTNKGVWNSSLAFGDYDNDGDLDLAVSGRDDLNNPRLILFKNTNGNFSEDQNPMGGTTQGVYYSSLAFGDYDNDGDLDLAVSGWDGTFMLLRLFKNTNGTFTSGQLLTGIYYSSLAFGDYDNDGDLDLAASGVDFNTYPRLILFKNTTGTFTIDQNPMGGTTQGVYNSSLAFGDYDNDGDLDLSVSGWDGTYRRLILFKNTNGNFSEDQNPMGGTTKGVDNSSLAFGDYDNDGDLDLAVSGEDDLNNPRLILFKNTNGNFSEDQNPMGGTTKGVDNSSLAFGDYDNDGDLDLAVSGWDDLNNPRLILFKNTNGNFSEDQNPMGGTTKGVYYGSIVFGDYDNDGDLDLAVSGWDQSVNEKLIVYKNGEAECGNANTAPGLAQNLSATYDEGIIKFTWDSATDGGSKPTPQQGLYYNLRVGTGTAVSASSSVVTGIYGSPLMGNYLRPKLVSSQYGVKISTGLIANTTYYWTVQAIDTPLNAGGWASLNSVYVPTVGTPQAPSAITNLSALTGDYGGEVKLTWSAPGDDGGTGDITNGKYGIKYATYTSFDFNGPSGFNILWTTSTSPGITETKVITGLTEGTTFYFRIWTGDDVLNWSGISNGATTWAQVDVAAPAAITNLSALTGDYGGEVKLSWTAPGDDGWNNDFDTGSQFDIRYSTVESESPSISTTTFASCLSVSQFSPIPTPVTALWPYGMTVTGLSPGVTYYFAIKTRDEVPNWSGLSNGATTLAQVTDNTAPEAITTLSALTGTGSGEIILSWTSPGDDGWNNDFDSGSQFDIRYSTVESESPSISTTTFANASSVSQFSPIPTPVTALWPYGMTVTGLSPGVTYYFAIKTRDEVPNWSGLSNGATTLAMVDTSPPNAITDLTGLCDSDTGDVTLSWSTPGDDGWTNTLPEGSRYRIDYSSYSIQWSTGNYKVEISTSGVSPHTQVSHTITGLSGETTWYFQIWVRDEVPSNWSGLSNGAMVWVNPVISVTIEPSIRAFGQVPANQSAVLSSEFAVKNNGNITQKYQLCLTDVPTGWTAKEVTGTPGWEEVKLLGLFTTQSPIETTHFDDNPPNASDGDIVRTTNNDIATSTNFAISGEGAEVKGYNVTIGGIRYLWFRFDAPSGTSITSEQFLTVTVTAIQQ